MDFSDFFFLSLMNDVMRNYIPKVWIKAQRIGEKDVSEQKPAGRIFSLARACLKRGQRLFDEGKQELAFSALEEALRIEPEAALIWFHKGYLYQEIGKHWKAIYAYQKGLKRKPDDADAWNNLAIANLEVGYKKAALRAFKKAIHIQAEQKTPYDGAYLNLSSLYLELGRVTDALLVCDAWIRAFPDSTEAIWRKRNILQTLQVKLLPRHDPWPALSNGGLT